MALIGNGDNARSKRLGGHDWRGVNARCCYQSWGGAIVTASIPSTTAAAACGRIWGNHTLPDAIHPLVIPVAQRTSLGDQLEFSLLQHERVEDAEQNDEEEEHHLQRQQANGTCAVGGCWRAKNNKQRQWYPNCQKPDLEILPIDDGTAF